jgi:hypothetical protein
MDWKKILLFLLIALLLSAATAAGYLYGSSSSGEDGDTGQGQSSENGDDEEEEEEVDTSAWKCHTIGGGPNISYIKYPDDWFYVSVSSDLPGSSYEMFVTDEAIDYADYLLQSGQALMVVSLGPNNSYGEPLSSVITAEKEFNEDKYPDATFEEGTIGDMEILITSYQEEGIKVREYYMVKEKATGFLIGRYLEDTMVPTFDAMLESVELNQIGIYE